jgi:hypothetical protein
MKKRAAGFTVGVIASAALLTAPAQATTVTIGSPGPASAVSAEIGSVATIVNTAIPGGNVTAPANGVITSWRIANASGGPFFLQAVHNSGGAYASTGSTGPGAVTGTGTLTFPANLPIAKGDLIGLVNSTDTGDDHIGAAESLGAAFIYFNPPLGAAPQTQAGGSADAEIGFNAQVLLNCIVPKLKGKKVGAAKKALTKAGCATPKVKKKGGKFVRKQSAAPGTEIRGDAAVKLKAGPKKK